MLKSARRKSCRRHPLALIWMLLLFTTILLFYECFQDEFSIVQFEKDKCPACYGNNLCADVFAGEFKLVGWSRWKLFQLFNPKKVFYAEYKGRTVVIKKLAHDEERNTFDRSLCAMTYHVDEGDCDVGTAAVYMAKEVGLQNFRLLPLANESDILRCPSQRLFDKIKLLKAVANSSSDEANLMTLLQLNAEPIILQLFKYEDGWPFPRYLGACGRAVVEEYIGPSLYDERNFSWKSRLKYAYQIALLASKLTENTERFLLYLTDATFDNFAVSSNGEVIVVDAESIVIVDANFQRQISKNLTNLNPDDRYANHVDLHADHLAYSPSDLCMHQLADHNYYVVCKGLLSQSPWSLGMPGGLLYDLPESFDKKWNLSALIKECSMPQAYYGRFQVFPKLLTNLRLAVNEVS